MPENMSINIVLSRGETDGESRVSFVQDAFRVAKDFLGEPVRIAENNWISDVFQEHPWSAKQKLLEAPLPDGAFLHVYGRRADGLESCLTVEEDTLLTYRLSAPLSVVSTRPLVVFERNLRMISELFDSRGEWLILAGPEVAVDVEDYDFIEGLVSDLDMSLLVFLLGPARLLPRQISGMRMVYNEGGVLFFRHEHALARISR